MGELIVKGRHLIYVDECTFNLWQTPNRAWVRSDTVLTLPSSRGKSITVIGAISEQVGLVHFKIFHGSNNSSTFKDFTKNLLRKVRNRATVYMDNLSVHHSKSITELFGERVDVRFLPPYSCVLNPIERLWSVVKK